MSHRVHSTDLAPTVVIPSLNGKHVMSVDLNNCLTRHPPYRAIRALHCNVDSVVIIQGAIMSPLASRRTDELPYQRLFRLAYQP